MSKKSAKSNGVVRPKLMLVEGEGIDVEYIRLSARAAEQIQRRGIAESDLDDLVSESDTESGICHATVSFDGAVVAQFSIEDFKKARPKVDRLGCDKSWFLVKEMTERGTYRSFEINGAFSADLLKCSPQLFDLNGFSFGYLVIDYDGREGVYGNPAPRYGGQWELVSPRGERSAFAIHED